MSTATWDHLPDDVWVRVLSCLLSQDAWVGSCIHKYRQWNVLSTQLVCKRLRTVFTDNPSLCCKLALSKPYDKQQLKILVSWVKQHASTITHLSTAFGSQQCLETVLTVMQQDHKLTAVSAFRPSPYAISLLANMRTLTHCTFVRPSCTVSLEPLASLPHLSMLSLDHANVGDVETLAHLTALKLKCSHLYCSHSLLCITALLDLDVTGSSIAPFHDGGVLACTQLKSLVCVYGDIQAADAALRLRTSQADSTVIPADLASLASLTSLVLTSSWKRQTTSLIWASKLVSLQSLTVNLPCAHVYLSGCIAALTNLMYLSIGAQRVNRHPVPCIVLDVEWTAFHVLKSASFTGVLKCDKSLYNLAALHSLESLVVCNIWYVQQDEGSAQEAWIGFAHWLGVRRPTVHFQHSLEEASKSEYNSGDEYDSESSGSEPD